MRQDSKTTKSSGVDFKLCEIPLDPVDLSARNANKEHVTPDSANKAFQWIAIPSCSSKVTYYYDVDNYVINAMATQFLISFLVLSWPACNLIERWGTRRAILLASLGGAIGCLIKCFCCNGQEGIYLLFVGQAVVSLGEQLIFSVPNRIASVWFPDHQVSSAVAICVIGNQLGVALGFVLPQYALDGCETREEIGHGLWRFFLGNAIFSWAVFIAGVWLIDEAPKHPPGEARLKQLLDEERNSTGPRPSYLQDMLKLGKQFLALMTDKNFNILVLSYGINVGSSYAIPTLLDQQLTIDYPDNSMLVARAGFLYVVFGLVGTVVSGHLLDKKHRYLLTNEVLTLLTILSICAFAYSCSYLRSTWSIYLSASLLGASQISLIVAGLELAVELTYPATELITSTVMNFWPQIWGTFFIFIGSHFIDTYGSLYGNMFYLVCALIALILLFNVREVLKRQLAVQEKHKLVQEPAGIVY